MTILSASIQTVVWRYFLMMGVIFATFLTGNFILGVVLAFPVFLTAILGVTLWDSKANKSDLIEVSLSKQPNVQKAA